MWEFNPSTNELGRFGVASGSRASNTIDIAQFINNRCLMTALLAKLIRRKRSNLAGPSTASCSTFWIRQQKFNANLSLLPTSKWIRPYFWGTKEKGSVLSRLSTRSRLNLIVVVQRHPYNENSLCSYSFVHWTRNHGVRSAQTHWQHSRKWSWLLLRTRNSFIQSGSQKISLQKNWFKFATLAFCIKGRLLHKDLV